VERTDADGDTYSSLGLTHTDVNL